LQWMHRRILEPRRFCAITPFGERFAQTFTKGVLDDLRCIFTSVCADFDAELVEFDGEDDHVHLLVNYPPKVAVSALVNSLKGVSSRMIRKKNYPSIRKKLWGGAPIEIIHQYIEQQQTPH